MLFFAIASLAAAYAVWRTIRLARADADLSVLDSLAKGIPAAAFEDKVVWITGASSGIGEAIALDLCARGAKLVLSARRTERLEDVKRRCKGKNASSVLIVPLDLEQYATHAAAAQTVVEKLGRVDVLVNNGGRSQRALVENTQLEVDQAMMALNVIGTLSITKAVLPHMLRQGSGHFVNISSVAGRIGAPVSASYAASKHALQGFFNTMRMELADKNIKVTMICPGPVRSEGAMNSFTGVAGERVGEHHIDDKKKMSAERCAELVAAATAHGLEEAWISRHPILLFVYFSQYLPSLASFLATRMATVRVQAFRNGERDINAGLSIKALLGRK